MFVSKLGPLLYISNTLNAFRVRYNIGSTFILISNNLIIYRVRFSTGYSFILISYNFIAFEVRFTIESTFILISNNFTAFRGRFNISQDRSLTLLTRHDGRVCTIRSPDLRNTLRVTLPSL